MYYDVVSDFYKKEKYCKMKDVRSIERNYLRGGAGLRGIAVLMIMFHHMSGYWGGTTWFGYVGVSIFAVMSGVLEGYHYINKEELPSGKSMLIKKIKQFLPLHLIMFIFALIILIIDQHKNKLSIYMILGKIVFNLTFLQAFVPVREIYFGLNGVEWYLTVYLLFVMFIPRIIKWIKRIEKKNYALVSIIILQLIFSVIIGNLNISENLKLWLIYINPLVRIWDFIEGVLVASMVVDKEYHIKEIYYGRNSALFYSIIEFISFVLFGVISVYGNYMPRYIAMVWIFTTLGLWIVYLFALNKGLISRLISGKYSPLVMVSKYGTEIYLMHQILYGYFFRANHHLLNISFPWIGIIVAVGVLLCAVIYNKIVRYLNR